MIDILYIWTEDDLRLQGIHYDSGKRDVCILIIHGMSGNFIENYFGKVLGETLEKARIGSIYAHNRGYNHINDILKKGGSQSERHGASYERFLDSEIDIKAWLRECERLGYKKVIILGHSLGCNKAINYLSKNSEPSVSGLILASPPDMVGLFEKYQENHKELVVEAKKNVEEGNPRQFVTGLVWDWYMLSSQTYLDLSETGGPVDNLPVRNENDEFSQLAGINLPILGIMAEQDDIAIRTLEEDMDLIASKAKKAKSFTKKFIKGANHVYDRAEEDLARVVAGWVKNQE